MSKRGDFNSCGKCSSGVLPFMLWWWLAWFPYFYLDFPWPYFESEFCLFVLDIKITIIDYKFCKIFENITKIYLGTRVWYYWIIVIWWFSSNATILTLFCPLSKSFVLLSRWKWHSFWWRVAADIPVSSKVNSELG